MKRHAPEEGRKWVQAVTDPENANPIYVARITGAEAIAAFMLKIRRGESTAGDAAKAIADFKHDFATQYQIIEITDVVVMRAMALIEAYKLRGYDGVQLAVALEVNDLIMSTGMPAVGVSALTLVSADDELNLAAAAEGLIVENPQTHLHPDDKTP